MFLVNASNWFNKIFKGKNTNSKSENQVHRNSSTISTAQQLIQLQIQNQINMLLHQQQQPNLISPSASFSNNQMLLQQALNSQPQINNVIALPGCSSTASLNTSIRQVSSQQQSAQQMQLGIPMNVGSQMNLANAASVASNNQRILQQLQTNALLRQLQEVQLQNRALAAGYASLGGTVASMGATPNANVQLATSLALRGAPVIPTIAAVTPAKTNGETHASIRAIEGNIPEINIFDHLSENDSESLDYRYGRKVKKRSKKI